ncbi:MAG: RMD1 family protein [Pirellulales bacterium]
MGGLGGDQKEELITSSTFRACARCLGEKFDLRNLQLGRSVAVRPLTLVLDGGGVAVVFRYGCVVVFQGGGAAESELLDELRRRVDRPYTTQEAEEIAVRVDPGSREGSEAGVVVLRDTSLARLQLLATVLSRSVALSRYEAEVTENFDRIEPFAVQLQERGKVGRNLRVLLQHVGSVLLSEHRMVARIETTDRPELIWEQPDLEPLYLRLEDEFELRDRDAVLKRKLELIGRTVETVLDLLQARRSLLVEWYIVILIVLEFTVSLYTLFWRS